MDANKKKKARRSNGGNNKVADKPICCYGDLCRNTKTIDRAHGFTAQCHFCDGYFHMYGCGNTETCKKCNPSQKSLYCITNDDAVVDEVPVNRGSNVEGVAGNKEDFDFWSRPMIAKCDLYEHVKKFLPAKFLKKVHSDVEKIQDANNNARDEFDNCVIDGGVDGAPPTLFTLTKFLVETVWQTLPDYANPHANRNTDSHVRLFLVFYHKITYGYVSEVDPESDDYTSMALNLMKTKHQILTYMASRKKILPLFVAKWTERRAFVSALFHGVTKFGSTGLGTDSPASEWMNNDKALSLQFWSDVEADDLPTLPSAAGVQVLVPENSTGRNINKTTTSNVRDPKKTVGDTSQQHQSQDQPDKRLRVDKSKGTSNKTSQNDDSISSEDSGAHKKRRRITEDDSDNDYNGVTGDFSDQETDSVIESPKKRKRVLSATAAAALDAATIEDEEEEAALSAADAATIEDDEEEEVEEEEEVVEEEEVEEVEDAKKEICHCVSCEISPRKPNPPPQKLTKEKALLYQKLKKGSKIRLQQDFLGRKDQEQHFCVCVVVERLDAASDKGSLAVSYKDADDDDDDDKVIYLGCPNILDADDNWVFDSDGLDTDEELDTDDGYFPRDDTSHTNDDTNDNESSDSSNMSDESWIIGNDDATTLRHICALTVEWNLKTFICVLDFLGKCFMIPDHAIKKIASNVTADWQQHWRKHRDKKEPFPILRSKYISKLFGICLPNSIKNKPNCSSTDINSKGLTLERNTWATDTTTHSKKHQTNEGGIVERRREALHLSVCPNKEGLTTTGNPNADSILRYNRTTHCLVAPIILALNQPFMCSAEEVIPMSAPQVNQRQVEQSRVLKIKKDTLLASSTKHTLLNSYSILPYTSVSDPSAKHSLPIEGTDANGNTIPTTKTALFTFLPNLVNAPPEENGSDKNKDDADKVNDEVTRYDDLEESMNDRITSLSSLSIILDKANTFDDGIVACIASLHAKIIEKTRLPVDSQLFPDIKFSTTEEKLHVLRLIMQYHHGNVNSFALIDGGHRIMAILSLIYNFEKIATQSGSSNTDTVHTKDLCRKASLNIYVPVFKMIPDECSTSIVEKNLSLTSFSIRQFFITLSSAIQSQSTSAQKVSMKQFLSNVIGTTNIIGIGSDSISDSNSVSASVEDNDRMATVLSYTEIYPDIGIVDALATACYISFRAKVGAGDVDQEEKCIVGTRIQANICKMMEDKKKIFCVQECFLQCNDQTLQSKARDKSVQVILKAIGHTSLCKNLIKANSDDIIIEEEGTKTKSTTTSPITLFSNIFDQAKKKEKEKGNEDRCMTATMIQRKTSIFLSVLKVLANINFRTKDDVLYTVLEKIDDIDTDATADEVYYSLVEKLLFKYLGNSNWIHNAKKGGSFALLSSVYNLWGGKSSTSVTNLDEFGDICNVKSSVPSNVALHYIVHLITDFVSPSSDSLQLLIEFFKAGFNSKYLCEPVIRTKDLNFLNNVLSAPLDILSKAMTSITKQRKDSKTKANILSTVLAMQLPGCWLQIVNHVGPEMSPTESLKRRLPVFCEEIKDHSKKYYGKLKGGDDCFDYTNVHLLAKKLAKLITDEIIVPSDGAWYTLVSSQKSDVDGLELSFVFKDHNNVGDFLLHDFVRYLFTGSFDFATVDTSVFGDTLRQNELKQKQIPTDKKKNTTEKGSNTRRKDVVIDEAIDNNKEEGDDDEEEEEEEEDEGLHEHVAKFESKISTLLNPNRKGDLIGDVVDAVEDDENRMKELEQIFNSSILVSNVMIAALNLVKNAAISAQVEKVELTAKKTGSYEKLVKTTFQQLMKNVRKSKLLQAELIVDNSHRTTAQSDIQQEKFSLEMRNDKSVTIDSVLNNLVDDRYNNDEDILCVYNPFVEYLTDDEAKAKDGNLKQAATNEDVKQAATNEDDDDDDITTDDDDDDDDDDEPPDDDVSSSENDGDGDDDDDDSKQSATKKQKQQQQE